MFRRGVLAVIVSWVVFAHAGQGVSIPELDLAPGAFPSRASVSRGEHKGRRLGLECGAGNSWQHIALQQKMARL